MKYWQDVTCKFHKVIKGGKITVSVKETLDFSRKKAD